MKKSKFCKLPWIRFWALFILLLPMTWLGCTKKKGTTESSTVVPGPKTVHIYTWSNYFNPAVIESFEKESGVKVQFSYFSSNEELLAKLQAGAKGYDVIVPSGYTIKALIGLGLLEPLNCGQWTEGKALDKRFQAPSFDPKLEFVAPYAWGLTAIAVDTDKIKTKVDSWSILFQRSDLKNQMTMLDDPPDVVGSAMKFLGYSINEKSAEALAKTKALLKSQKKFLKAYSSENQPGLLSGEVTVAQAYSSDILQVKVKKPSIELVLPKEGGVIWVDNLAIPKGSEHIDEAKTFIKYMLRKEIQALQGPFVQTFPVVAIPGSKAPTEAQLSKFEFTSDDPALHDEIQKLWTELKAE